jgi:hypothetical protein
LHRVIYASTSSRKDASYRENDMFVCISPCRELETYKSSRIQIKNSILVHAALLNVQFHIIPPNYKLSRRSVAGYRALVCTHCFLCFLDSHTFKHQKDDADRFLGSILTRNVKFWCLIYLHLFYTVDGNSNCRVNSVMTENFDVEMNLCSLM